MQPRALSPMTCENDGWLLTLVNAEKSGRSNRRMNGGVNALRNRTRAEGPSGFLKSSALLWYFGGGSIEVSSAHSPPRPCKKMVCGARCGGWKWPKKACGRRRAHCDPAVEQGRRACRGPGSGGARGTTFCSPFRLAPLPLRFHADTAAAQRSPRCHFDAGQEIVKM